MSDDHKELCKRLRAYNDTWVTEAADLIEQQAQQIAALTADRDKQRAAFYAANQSHLDAMKERDALRAENERLEKDAEIGKLVRRKMHSLNTIPMERCVVRADEISAIDALKDAP